MSLVLWFGISIVFIFSFVASSAGYQAWFLKRENSNRTKAVNLLKRVVFMSAVVITTGMICIGFGLSFHTFTSEPEAFWTSIAVNMIPCFAGVIVAKLTTGLLRRIWFSYADQRSN